ncbi:MAG: hypothetical protein KJ043_05880 [Anaerolineae bacterium]|nr:hypothetical protein [Anaerolineae bacterium]
MNFTTYFSPIDITSPRLPDVPAVEMMPYTSEYDFLLFSLIQHPYYVVDSATQTVYEGNHLLLNFLYHPKNHYPTQIMADDGSWRIIITIRKKLWTQEQVIFGYGEPIIAFLRDYPHRRYTQAQLEGWAKTHPDMRLAGDGERDWLIYDGKDNPVKSYIVISTNPYIVFLKKEDDSLFRKVWELYGGIELSAGIIDKQGIIHATEGHGISDPAMIYIQAETGIILSTEPTVQLTHRRY